MVWYRRTLYELFAENLLVLKESMMKAVELDSGSLFAMVRVGRPGIIFHVGLSVFRT